MTMKFTDTLKELEAKADKSQYYAHLCNHAKEIINLVEAAEQLVNGGHPDEAIHHMTKALDALNKENNNG